jgi:hypothetical protein
MQHDTTLQHGYARYEHTSEWRYGNYEWTYSKYTLYESSRNGSTYSEYTCYETTYEEYTYNEYGRADGGKLSDGFVLGA